MKKLALLALVTAAGLLAQGPGGRAGRMGFGGPGAMGFGGPQAAVTGAPYSGVEVTTSQQALAGGNLIQNQHQTTVYRDSQGRVRTETTMQHPGANNGQTTSHTMISVHDPVAGVMRHIDTENRVVSETPIHTGGPGFRPNGANQPRGGATPGQHPNFRQGADPNVKTEELGTQTINGLSATGRRITRTIPAGAMGNTQPIQSVREVWTSPDLKVPILVKTSDPRFGTTVTQLTNITRAEPDAALFQPPAGYTVRQGAPNHPVGRGARGNQ